MWGVIRLQLALTTSAQNPLAAALDSFHEYQSHLWVPAFFLPHAPSIQVYDSAPPVIFSASYSEQR